MKDQFLTGDFLPGHQSVFTLHDPEPKRTEPVDASELEGRLERRTDRFRRGSEHYVIGFEIGAILALVVITFAFKVPLVHEAEYNAPMADQELVTMEEIQQTKQQELPPAPPRPPVPVEVPNDELFEDVDLNLDASLVLTEALDVPPPPPAPAVAAVEEEDDAEIFVVVEEMPTLVGGIAAVMAVLDYPEVARMARVEGLVVVQVVVNKDGTPSDPIVAKSVADVLDEAAVAAVMKQRFVPGKQRSKAVRTRYAIPVRFRLN